jgi:hypothetical protein
MMMKKKRIRVRLLLLPPIAIALLLFLTGDGGCGSHLDYYDGCQTARGVVDTVSATTRTRHGALRCLAR